MARALLMLLVWGVFFNLVGPTIRGALFDERTEVNSTWKGGE
jgi:hypothetical protein